MMTIKIYCRFMFFPYLRVYVSSSLFPLMPSNCLPYSGDLTVNDFDRHVTSQISLIQESFYKWGGVSPGGCGSTVGTRY